MISVRTIAEVRERVAAARHDGKIVGFVPTMGALHAGHGALLDRARRETNFVVVSIFVNPIQFDRRADYEAYRINLSADLDFSSARGTDLVFAPSAEEMYPDPIGTSVDVAGLSEHLCGKFRPGHFRGVATVVAKLLHIVGPCWAYFGEKDAQQLAIIRRMVVDLSFAVKIVPVPTVREPDGLALSSRNARLTAEERSAGPVLFRAINQALRRLTEGARCAADIRRAALEVLAHEPAARVEYLEVVDAETMAPVDPAAGRVVIAAAVWFGATRLIDNVAVDVTAHGASTDRTA